MGFKYSFKSIHAQDLYTQILKIILALIIFCTSPLIPLYTLNLLLLRQFVFVCAKIFRKDLKGFVTTASVLLAQENIWKKPTYNLVAILAFDGPIELEELRRVFQQRVVSKLNPANGELLYPQLKQYWTSYLNYLFWKQDESFDVKNHIRRYDNSDSDSDNVDTDTYGSRSLHLTLPVKKDGTCDEDSIRRVMGGLLAKPWKEERSCWEMLLVNDFKSVEMGIQSHSEKEKKNGSLLIFRLHHGMGDGYSILKLLMRDMFQVEPKIQINFKKMSAWDRVQEFLVLPIKMPWTLAGLFADSFDGTNCWHYLDKELSREYFTTISKPLDVDLIKGIKNKWGVRYQTVLCAAVANGCRRVMEDAGQEVPEQITCLVPTPLENHPDGLVNHLTATYLKWPMNITNTKNGNPYTSKDRLQLISKSSDKSKSYIGQLGFRFLTKLACWAPNFISQMGCKVPCTVILSNFPGPGVDAPKSFLDCNYTDIIAGAGCGPGQVGATMMLVSSNGKQRCVMSVDKSVFPSQRGLQYFDRYVEQELQALMTCDDDCDSDNANRSKMSRASSKKPTMLSTDASMELKTLNLSSKKNI